MEKLHGSQSGPAEGTIMRCAYCTVSYYTFINVNNNIHPEMGDLSLSIASVVLLKVLWTFEYDTGCVKLNSVAEGQGEEWIEQEHRVSSS